MEKADEKSKEEKRLKKKGCIGGRKREKFVSSRPAKEDVCNGF